MKYSYWALGGAILMLASPLRAEPRTHDGFYLSLQGGLGYLSSTADFAQSEQTLAGTTLSSALLIGGTVGPVAIGGGFTYDNAFSPHVKQDGDEQELDNVELFLVGIGAFADFYPDPRKGLHILGFVGWGGLESSVNGDVGGSDPTGMLISAGVGYDFWVSDEWSIGPLGRITYAPLSLGDVGYRTTQISVLADLKFH
jgi:hypothetical protein